MSKIVDVILFVRKILKGVIYGYYFSERYN